MTLGDALLEAALGMYPSSAAAFREVNLCIIAPDRTRAVVRLDRGWIVSRTAAAGSAAHGGTTAKSERTFLPSARAHRRDPSHEIPVAQVVLVPSRDDVRLPLICRAEGHGRAPCNIGRGNERGAAAEGRREPAGVDPVDQLADVVVHVAGPTAVPGGS